MKTFCIITCLLMLVLSQQVMYAQQPLAQQAFAVFEQHCLDCHGEFGSYSDVLIIKHKDLMEDRAVVPRQPDASELYLRLLGDTDTGSQMPLGQDPLDPEEIATIRRWIEAGAPDWETIPKPKRRFITTEATLKTIHTHVTSLTAFDRSFARYFTLTHLYNAGATDDNLRAYRNALSKLVNSLSWGAEVIKPTPIDREETIFYIDLRHYEWDVKSDKWYKIEQAYPYGVQLKSSTYTTLCQETDCELPFVRADWFIATASLPPLYHEILELPETDKALETRLEVDVVENLKNAPGVRVWRAGFNESGVSVNNRVVERHKSRYGAYWKSYDFAGNVGTQNIFTHPLNFTHDGGEIIFNLPNGLQAYYLSTAKGERLDEAPINIVSNAGARDPVVRNGLSCMGCHTEGMKTFTDQVRSVVEQDRNPSYDKAQALRLYAEKSEMDSLVREDIARYRRAIEAAGGVFGGIEPIQQLVKQFEGPLDASHAAAEVGLETDDFLKKIQENSTLQNAGLLVLGVENGSVKRDAWESQFGKVVSGLTLDKQSSLSPAQAVKGSEKESAEGFVKLEMPLEEVLTKITFIVTDLSGDSNEEVVFEGEGVTHHSDYLHLRKREGEWYSYYTLLAQHAVEGNRYIFVLLAQGGGSRVFWNLHVVDKKTLRTVDEVGLGEDRAVVREVALAEAHSDTATITYIKREVIKGKVVYDPKKAIKKHFRMIQGTLQEVTNPLSPSGADKVLIPDQEVEVPSKAQILLNPSEKWTNQLINETSPYLLLHAHNPVDWYPWGDEALALAKKENKIIFLSVGYSTCYWCHVMERKVFSNPEIAAVMNKNFINIKIDREERPDLDEIYMTATQLLVQRGGWPNSVFLTPDLQPFYAGTYFPPTDMPGRPGFPTILDAVHEAWVTREAEVIKSAKQISNAIEMATSRGFTALSAKVLDRSLITGALDHLRTNYSHAYGGFGTAPKFPSPANLEFLLSEYERNSGLQTPPTGNESLLQMVTRTLDMMAYGGMYDQIGGGFHRYSVDAKWLIPHFEKMLYDNAQLAKVYLQAYQLTQEPRYRRVAEEIFSYIFREMTAPEGGFYSALDAETDAEEGKYYVWTADEIRKILGKKDASHFNEVYGVDKGSNFEGNSVLYVPEGSEAENFVKSLSTAREKLLTARFEREYPLLDTKIIVNWNGLMIDALAYGYQVLGEERYLAAASKAAAFILDTLKKPDGELRHTYTAGVVKQDAYLDDYAFLVRGLLGLYQATGEEQWLDSARALTDKMIQLFWDDKNGGFYYTKADAKHLIVRTKKPYDSAIPSGNAVAVKNLLAFGADYRHYTEKTLRTFAESMAQSPSSFMYMHFALNHYLTPAEDQNLSTPPLVTTTAKIKKKDGEVFNVELQLKIAAGWHINANPAGQDNLIPTTVELNVNAPVEIVDIAYPKGKTTRFEFSNASLNVYEKSLTIPLQLKQKPNITRKKNVPITLKLTYQPCNDTECLLPETLDIPLELP